MKKTLLLLLTFFSLSSFAQYPWPDGLPCGRHVGVNIDGRLLDSYTQYNWYAGPWKENIDMMAELLKKPGLKLSFEYLQYRSGYSIMKREVDYATDCSSFPELDQETKDLMELQKKRKLTADDFKGPNWIHTLQAIDRAEVNCMAMSKINGKMYGCGDLWQDGITEDEAVCFKGKTYLKCHIDCIETIYNRQLDLQPGFCK